MEGRLERAEPGVLPIVSADASAHAGHLPRSEAPSLADLRVVPAAHAATRGDQRKVYVTGSLVNLRAGPGLAHRMISVAEFGDTLEIAGAEEAGWLPVTELATGASAWISADFVSPAAPGR